MIAEQDISGFSLPNPDGFGDGTHPSTWLAVEAMREIAGLDVEVQKVLDVGAGSGVLSILSVQLFDPAQVVATELDAQAYRAACENVRSNGMAQKVRVVRADGVAHRVVAQHAPFDLVLHNILALPAIEHARALAGVMHPGSVIVISGVLVWRVPMVQESYESLGFTLVSQYHTDTWACLLFVYSTSTNKLPI